MSRGIDAREIEIYLVPVSGSTIGGCSREFSSIEGNSTQGNMASSCLAIPASSFVALSSLHVWSDWTMFEGSKFEAKSSAFPSSLLGTSSSESLFFPKLSYKRFLRVALGCAFSALFKRASFSASSSSFTGPVWRGWGDLLSACGLGFLFLETHKLRMKLNSNTSIQIVKTYQAQLLQHFALLTKIKQNSCDNMYMSQNNWWWNWKITAQDYSILYKRHSNSASDLKLARYWPRWTNFKYTHRVYWTLPLHWPVCHWNCNWLSGLTIQWQGHEWALAGECGARRQALQHTLWCQSLWQFWVYSLWHPCWLQPCHKPLLQTPQSGRSQDEPVRK